MTEKTYREVEEEINEQLPATVRCVVEIHRLEEFTRSELQDEAGVSRGTATDTIQYLEVCGSVEVVGRTETNAILYQHT